MGWTASPLLVANGEHTDTCHVTHASCKRLMRHIGAAMALTISANDIDWNICSWPTDTFMHVRVQCIVAQSTFEHCLSCCVMHATVTMSQTLESVVTRGPIIQSGF